MGILGHKDPELSQGLAEAAKPHLKKQLKEMMQPSRSGLGDNAYGVGLPALARGVTSSQGPNSYNPLSTSSLCYGLARSE